MSTPPAAPSATASWAEAWLAALSAFSHPGRMRRGEHFARRKRIRHFEVKPGLISARVPEDDLTYEVRLQIKPLDDATWQKIVRHLASQALYSARLLAGEMPAEVAAVFASLDAPLFPAADALEASCTCPDWEVPCKHIAALYYLLAEKFEENPFLLFLARGRSKEQVLDQLRQERQLLQQRPAPAAGEEEGPEEEAPATPPLAAQLERFYTFDLAGDEMPFHIAPPATPMPHLRRLGRPSFTEIDLEALLAPIYQTLTEKALHWAFHDTPETA